MERIARLSLLVALAVASWVGRASAGLHETREDALRHIFGSAAHCEARTVYLTPAQVDSVQHLAQAEFDTPRLTYWVAMQGDRLLGRAYIDTHPVRTMPATLMVAVDPAGAVAAVEVLAFHEPEDYLPPQRWLARLVGRALSVHLRPGDAVDGITGATLSARAMTAAVRRSLALDHVLRGESR